MIPKESYMSNRITSGQIRAARAMLGWSGKDLAERSGVGLATIRRAEAGEGIPEAHLSTINVLRLTFQGCGIEFTGDPLVNPGVILNITASSSK